MILRIPQWLTFCLILLVRETTSFRLLILPTIPSLADVASPYTATITSSRSASFQLFMGGYYSEPEYTISGGVPSSTTTRKQHMIFGSPCAEESFVVDSIPITHLLPLDENQDKNDEEKEEGTFISSQQLLLHYTESVVDLRNMSVLELGASAVSLAAALALGASSVMVCHPDPKRLQVWEHGYQFFNMPTAASRAAAVETTQVDWPLGSLVSMLPPVDVVFVTLSFSLDDATSFSRIVEQITRNGSRLIMLAPPGMPQEQAASSMTTEGGDATYSVRHGILDIQPHSC